MQELIAIESTPARLDVNFDELVEALEKELERYDVVVTVETVKDAKALATELNKTKKAIDDRIKEEIQKASEPIKAVDAQRKELIRRLEEGRVRILDQVKRFDDERREQCRRLLEDAREELWADLGVGAEFRRADYEDLVILSNLTEKGHLTAKARGDLRGRVQEDKALQDQTERRLLELETSSYKAGLAAPLGRDHVAHFLEAPEEEYRVQLDRILAAEVDRQRKAEAAERERIEAQQRRQEREEAERKARAEAAEAERVRREQEQQAEAPAQQNGEKANGSPATPAPDATEWVKVECVFRIEVPTTASNQAIEGKLREMMAEAGFQSSPEINVVRLD